MNDTDGGLQARLAGFEALWDPRDAAASEAALTALLGEAEALGGRERHHALLLQTWIGRALGQQGKLPESRALLEKVEKQLADPESKFPVSVRIRWLMEHGRLHVLEKTPSQARTAFLEAWTLAINSGEDSLAVEAAQLMAGCEQQKAQQGWILRAIELAEGSPSQGARRWLGSLLTTLGWKLFDLRRFGDALETFQKALRHLKAQGAAHEAFVAQWSIGKVLRALGRVEEALAIQQALLAELGIGGRRDGRLYEELAECLQTLKRAEEAQLYFELAYRQLSDDDWVNDNQPLQLKRMKDLGKVK